MEEFRWSSRVPSYDESFGVINHMMTADRQQGTVRPTRLVIPGESGSPCRCGRIHETQRVRAECAADAKAHNALLFAHSHI